MNICLSKHYGGMGKLKFHALSLHVCCQCTNVLCLGSSSLLFHGTPFVELVRLQNDMQDAWKINSEVQLKCYINL